MKKLLFDETNHKYYVNGFAVPGVSEILEVTGAKHPIPEFMKEYVDIKAELGTDVHEITELHDSWGLYESDIEDENLKPYFQAYLDFLNDYKPEYLEIEQKRYAKLIESETKEEFLFAGTIDRYAKIDNNKCIIDIKTGNQYRWQRLQTMAYAILMGCKKDALRFNLFLKDDGSYILKQHKKNKEDFENFTLCLNWFYYLRPRYCSKKYLRDENVKD